jgi:hypothetical protein
MSQNEVIADKIEEVIGRMFFAFSEYETKSSEYSLCFNPSKYRAWFIEIYFPDRNQLRIAINNGTCYEIHRYLLKEFEGIEELESVERSIFFEFGNRPVNEEDYGNRHSILIEKTKRLLGASGQSDVKSCYGCGHDFDLHQLRGFTSNGSDAPTEGWIMCPDENCNCFLTWGANYNGIKN